MTQYIALLRGINIGGKNIIKMSELKTAFGKRKFCDVCTYINSGNVLFQSNLSGTDIKTACEELIFKNFNLDIPVCIISAVDLIATGLVFFGDKRSYPLLSQETRSDTGEARLYRHWYRVIAYRK